MRRRRLGCLARRLFRRCRRFGRLQLRQRARQGFGLTLVHLSRQDPALQLGHLLLRGRQGRLQPGALALARFARGLSGPQCARLVGYASRQLGLLGLQRSDAICRPLAVGHSRRFLTRQLGLQGPMILARLRKLPRDRRHLAASALRSVAQRALQLGDLLGSQLLIGGQRRNPRLGPTQLSLHRACLGLRRFQFSAAAPQLPVHLGQRTVRALQLGLYHFQLRFVSGLRPRKLGLSRLQALLGRLERTLALLQGGPKSFQLLRCAFGALPRRFDFRPQRGVPDGRQIHDIGVFGVQPVQRLLERCDLTLSGGQLSGLIGFMQAGDLRLLLGHELLELGQLLPRRHALLGLAPCLRQRLVKRLCLTLHRLGRLHFHGAAFALLRCQLALQTGNLSLSLGEQPTQNGLVARLGRAVFQRGDLCSQRCHPLLFHVSPRLQRLHAALRGRHGLLNPVQLLPLLRTAGL